MLRLLFLRFIGEAIHKILPRDVYPSKRVICRQRIRLPHALQTLTVPPASVSECLPQTQQVIKHPHHQLSTGPVLVGVALLRHRLAAAVRAS
jgi:hypothetical protein